MGFFARKGAASQRNQGSQEEQLVELRRRARRRLIGALVIVLIAVVFVPVFLKSDGAEEVEQVVQVFPPIVAPDSEPQAGSTALQDNGGYAPVDSSDVEDIQDPLDEQSTSDTQVLDESAVNIPEIEMQTEAEADHDSARQSEQESETKPKESEPSKEKTEPKPEPKPKAETVPNEPERTDDGSVALALLEGRTPEESGSSNQNASAQRGSFTVQVAAYSSSEGASNRREQLSSAGVSNAFVEESGGTYRLRVGPFESRQAAEAALTRLRSLGYDDSFIRSQ
ncbi:MAG TPA: SPOR domain-containing protein [Paenalcaligenes sp.]|nr:SPOR domain-containing protein [Paenalcaligenes sp.]